MSGPEAYLPASYGTPLERSREDVLEAARPLPPDKDVVIEELSDDEDRRFLRALGIRAMPGRRAALIDLAAQRPPPSSLTA